MANKILPGYTTPMGDKYLVVFDHSGPSSYTQVGSSGAYSTGGDVIAANGGGLNLGGFDALEPDATDQTGQFIAYAIPLNGGNGNAVPSYVLKWYSLVTATVGGQSQTAGTEVHASTNLSTFYLRLKAWMV